MQIYFIGIGGIGMSAIARYYHQKGHSVSGYDKTASPLTHCLENEGIKVHYTEDISYIPTNKQDTIVVYTPAIPEEMIELQYVKQEGYKVIKRSQMLGELTKGENCLAVAGTHGKTTTSTLIAHILTESGRGCSAFLGGISKNYNSNLLLDDGPTVVVEADEFDRSFLQLHPLISVITSMDADHLDIYGSLENLQETFREYASQVRETLIYKLGLPLYNISAKMYSYHLDSPNADFHAININLDPQGYYHYDLEYPGGVLNDIKVGAIGKVNVENSIAAAALCLCYGVDAQQVRAAIASFTGAKRRLDLHINKPDFIYIDDYAHHPEELKAAITSVKEIFPDKNLTAVFQPHLYTRTRDFAPEFAEALSLADKLILLDIYPARELPIEGVTSEIIYKDITCDKVLITKSELMTYLQNNKPELLLTLGAGDIDRFIEPICNL